MKNKAYWMLFFHNLLPIYIFDLLHLYFNDEQLKFCGHVSLFFEDLFKS